MRTTRPGFSAPRSAVLSPLAAALAMAIAPQAHAFVRTVSTAADSGAGSLRQTILDANAACNAFRDGAPTIVFIGPFTITPSSPLPVFSCGSMPYTPVIDATTYG